MATTSYKTLPQPLIEFPTVPETIIRKTEKYIATTRQVQDTLVAIIKPEEATFSNVILPIINDENTKSQEGAVLRFFNSVSPSKGLREAAAHSRKLFEDATVDEYMREDVFKLIDAVIKRNETLDPESQHYLRKLHRKYIEHGLGIPAGPSRDRFEVIRKEISAAARECQLNFNEERGGIWLTREQLKGVPDDILENFKIGECENEGKLSHTFKPPELIATAQFAEDSETRKAVFVAAENRCNKNVEPMRQLFILKDEMARLLGFSSYAAFKLDDLMSKTPENISTFLDDLKKMLTPRAEAEIAELLELKKKDLKARGLEVSDDERLYLWDAPYYRARLGEQTLSYNHAEVSEYFPMETTLQGIFRVFEQLLGLRVIRVSNEDIPESSEGTSWTWEESVRIYSIWDDEQEGGGFLGYIYIDLYPREFKRGHGGHYLLQPGFTHADGTRHYPSSAMVLNCPSPTPTRPSLLKHRDVISLFHELGQGFRNVVTRTKYSSSHGNLDNDFVKVHSKILDNWFWDPEQLKALGRHYTYLKPEYMQDWKAKAQQTGGLDDKSKEFEAPSEQIPDSLVDSIITSRGQGQALLHLQQVFLTTWDLKVHNCSTHKEALSQNPTILYNSLREDITKLHGLPEYNWGNNNAKFQHMFGKFGATYYGYLYAESVATDLFLSEEGFGGRTGDGEVGRRYRYGILERGGSRPQFEGLREFLGRDPKSEAFIGRLGGEGK